MNIHQKHYNINSYLAIMIILVWYYALMDVYVLVQAAYGEAFRRRLQGEKTEIDFLNDPAGRKGAAHASATGRALSAMERSPFPSRKAATASMRSGRKCLHFAGDADTAGKNLRRRAFVDGGFSFAGFGSEAAASPDPVIRFSPTSYLCTRPEPSPPISFSTSPTDTRLKSPEMECLRQLAATANASASARSSKRVRP